MTRVSLASVQAAMRCVTLPPLSAHCVVILVTAGGLLVTVDSATAQAEPQSPESAPIHEEDTPPPVVPTPDERRPQDDEARRLSADDAQKRADIDFSTVRTYWAETKEFWAHMRNSWTVIMDGERTVRLAKKWEKKPLYRHMFGLAEQWRSEPDSKDALVKRLKVVLDGFHADNAAVAPPENDAKTY